MNFTEFEFEMISLWSRSPTALPFILKPSILWLTISSIWLSLPSCLYLSHSAYLFWFHCALWMKYLLQASPMHPKRSSEHPNDLTSVYLSTFRWSVLCVFGILQTHGLYHPASWARLFPYESCLNLDTLCRSPASIPMDLLELQGFVYLHYLTPLRC